MKKKRFLLGYFVSTLWSLTLIGCGVNNVMVPPSFKVNQAEVDTMAVVPQSKLGNISFPIANTNVEKKVIGWIEHAQFTEAPTFPKGSYSDLDSQSMASTYLGPPRLVIYTKSGTYGISINPTYYEFINPNDGSFSRHYIADDLTAVGSNGKSFLVYHLRSHMMYEWLHYENKWKKDTR